MNDINKVINMLTKNLENKLSMEEIDKFLFQIEKSNNLTNIESMNKSNVRINKILQLIQKNKHKLAMPEICKIN